MPAKMKSVDELQRCRVIFDASRDDIRRWRRAAAELGLNLSSWLRLALRGAVPLPLPKREK